MGRIYKNRFCEVCGKEYTPTASTQTLCSKECRAVKRRRTNGMIEGGKREAKATVSTNEDITEVEKSFTALQILVRRILDEKYGADQQIAYLAKKNAELSAKLRNIEKELQQFRHFILKNTEDVNEAPVKDMPPTNTNENSDIPAVQRDITELESAKKKLKE